MDIMNGRQYLLDWKKTLQIFQQKMDNIFRNDDFIVTYIDDILVFSKSIKEHVTPLMT